MVKIPTFSAEGRITAEAPSVQTNVQTKNNRKIGSKNCQAQVQKQFENCQTHDQTTCQKCSTK